MVNSFIYLFFVLSLSGVILLIYFFLKIFWAASSYRKFLRRSIPGYCSLVWIEHLWTRVATALFPWQQSILQVSPRNLLFGAHSNLWLWNGATNKVKMKTELGPCWATSVGNEYVWSPFAYRECYMLVVARKHQLAFSCLSIEPAEKHPKWN